MDTGIGDYHPMHKKPSKCRVNAVCGIILFFVLLTITLGILLYHSDNRVDTPLPTPAYFPESPPASLSEWPLEWSALDMELKFSIYDQWQPLSFYYDVSNRSLYKFRQISPGGLDWLQLGEQTYKINGGVCTPSTSPFLYPPDQFEEATFVGMEWAYVDNAWVNVENWVATRVDDVRYSYYTTSAARNHPIMVINIDNPGAPSGATEFKVFNAIHESVPAGIFDIPRECLGQE